MRTKLSSLFIKSSILLALPIGAAGFGVLAGNYVPVSQATLSKTNNEVIQLNLDIGRLRDDICRHAGPTEIKNQGGSFLEREWRFSAKAIDQNLPDYARYGITHVGCQAQSLDSDQLSHMYLVSRPIEKSFIR